MTRPFNEDEFLLLSRRGSIGPSASSRPVAVAPKREHRQRTGQPARRWRLLTARPWRHVKGHLPQ
jgi:hypothetical protein